MSIMAQIQRVLLKHQLRELGLTLNQEESTQRLVEWVDRRQQATRRVNAND